MNSTVQGLREAKYAKRKLVNRVAIALALAAMVFGLF